jgi:hypothetical protein
MNEIVKKDRYERCYEMINGISKARDENYFSMTHGKVVYVACRNDTIIKGSIRLLKEGAEPPEGIPCYIVEKEDGEILKAAEFHNRPHNPPHQIGYKADIPMLFTIDKPNHKYIFESLEAQEFQDIEEYKAMAKRMGLNVYQMLERIGILMDKHPHKFI